MRRWEWKGERQKKKDDITTAAMRAWDFVQFWMILTKHVDHVPFPKQVIPEIDLH